MPDTEHIGALGPKYDPRWKEVGPRRAEGFRRCVLDLPSGIRIRLLHPMCYSKSEYYGGFEVVRLDPDAEEDNEDVRERWDHEWYRKDLGPVPPGHLWYSPLFVYRDEEVPGKDPVASAELEARALAKGIPTRPLSVYDLADPETFRQRLSDLFLAAEAMGILEGGGRWDRLLRRP